jgi:hypothetical protein
MTDLGVLVPDSGSSAAVDVNDRGQIVGMVDDAGTSGGTAVMWTVPRGR